MPKGRQAEEKKIHREVALSIWGFTHWAGVRVMLVVLQA